jgi:hypothetical protein
MKLTDVTTVGEFILNVFLSRFVMDAPDNDRPSLHSYNIPCVSHRKGKRAEIEHTYRRRVQLSRAAWRRLPVDHPPFSLAPSLNNYDFCALREEGAEHLEWTVL